MSAGGPARERARIQPAWHRARDRRGRARARWRTPDRVFDAEEILRVLAAHSVDFVVIGGVRRSDAWLLRADHGPGHHRPAGRRSNLSRLSEALADSRPSFGRPGTLKLTDPHQLRRAPLVPLMTGPVRSTSSMSSTSRGAALLRRVARRRARRSSCRGLEVAVAGLSDLIRMKRAAGRADHDLAISRPLTQGALSQHRGMDLDVLFLGTAGSSPSPRRGLPATLVRRGGDRLLFDCGEGTQRQLMRLGRAGRARGALHHPLPRRPRARASGDAEDVRAAAARARARRLRPARARAASTTCSRPSSAGSAFRVRLEELDGERRARARRLPDRRLRGGPRRAGARLRARRGPAAGAVRPRAGARAGRAARAGLRPAPARRGGRRRPARPGDGGDAPRPQGRAHAATPLRAT